MADISIFPHDCYLPPEQWHSGGRLAIVNNSVIIEILADMMPLKMSAIVIAFRPLAMPLQKWTPLMWAPMSAISCVVLLNTFFGMSAMALIFKKTV
jgi:hypothetical protein